MGDSCGVHSKPPHTDGEAAEEQWVIWNGGSGILALATLGKTEPGPHGTQAWMASPFEMLGPFSLDELLAVGRIAFAACIVMSRLRWQLDQVELRREAHEKRRAAQERLHESHARFNQEGSRHHRSRWQAYDEKQHRQTLNLPAEGQLEPAQIKTAFRRLAQRAHPDQGGSHELFVKITEARNALLDQLS